MEKTQEQKIQLPTQVKTEVNKNIESLVLFGLPKSGKTTAASMLKNCLIIDTEQGTSFIDGAFVMQIPQDVGPVGKFKWLKDVASQIRAQDKPYDYVVIDTISELDTLSEFTGTYNYLNSSQGKKFNRDEAGNILKPSDPNYESVLSLPNGYGYRWSRDSFMDMFNSLKGLGKIATIFISHVSDKMISKTPGTEVVTKDLNLTGKLRDIVPRVVDAVGHIYNEDGEIMISFVGNEEKIGGVRAKHLRGFEGKLEWDKIFI